MYNDGYQSKDSVSGGGFLSPHPDESHGADSSGAFSKASIATQTLRPVTIRQIVETTTVQPDSSFKLDGHLISQIVFYGIVRSMNTQPSSLVYTIEDGTGKLDVRLFLEPGPGEEIAMKRCEFCREKKYVRIIGQLKYFSGKRHVLAFDIRPVTDANEITYHLLNVIAVHLYFTKELFSSSRAAKFPASLSRSSSVNMASNPYQEMNVDSGFGTASSGNGDFTSLQNRIIQIVKSEPKNSIGISKTTILSRLENQFSGNDITNNIEFLIGEGHLYITIDEDHVLCTS